MPERSHVLCKLAYKRDPQIAVVLSFGGTLNRPFHHQIPGNGCIAVVMFDAELVKGFENICFEIVTVPAMTAALGVSPRRRRLDCRSGDSARCMDSPATCLYSFYAVVSSCVTGRELLKLLKANGWRLDRIRRSHHIMTRGTKTISVPVHRSKDLPKGTLNAILKEAGIR